MAAISRARNCTIRRAGPGRATGSLNTARAIHTATLLPNGKVLVAGGRWQRRQSCQRGTVRPGERDLECHGQPQHRTLITRRPCCPTARCWWQGEIMAAAFLRERGTVRPGQRDLECHGQPQHRTLLSHGDLAAQRHGAGCRGRSALALASAELYDPASGTWSPRAASTPRALGHTATLLSNGMVLVAGGFVVASLWRARNCTRRLRLRQHQLLHLRLQRPPPAGERRAVPPGRGATGARLARRVNASGVPPPP